MDFNLIDFFNRSLEFNLKDFFTALDGIDIFAFCADLSTFFLHTLYQFREIRVARFAEFVLLHMFIIII